MGDLDALINEGSDPRALKRALSVKMGQQGFSPVQIGQLLNVSPQYVSKWKGRYQRAGVGGLEVGYRGSERYLTEGQREDVLQWVGGHQTLSVGAVRDYVEAHYGVVYHSKQSYYELLAAGGMSYHRSEKVNPKRDEAQVVARREEIKKNWRRTKKKLNAKS